MAECKLDAIVLSPEAVWIDELAWSDVKAKMKRTLHGTAIISANSVVQDQGRPITLTGENFWITYLDLKALQVLANTNTVMTYQHHDGRTFQVHFRYWDVPIIDAQPLAISEAAPEDTSQYKVTIKLVIV